ncbi:MAG TPA: hypothetical protein VFK52_02095 [Nocardioidaceae bacterium]|nr:hypothetical protein [Nocardioidaceae bacterium]
MSPMSSPWLRSLAIFSAGCLAVLGISGAAAQTDDARNPLTEQGTFTKIYDAEIEDYAAHYGVSLDEARRIPELQVASPPVREKIMELAGDRYIEVRMEHGKDAHLAAFVTSGSLIPELNEYVARSDLPVKLAYVSAPTDAEWLQIKTRVAQAFTGTPGLVDWDFNEPDAEIVLGVDDRLPPSSEADFLKRVQEVVGDPSIRVVLNRFDGVTEQGYERRGGNPLRLSSGVHPLRCTQGFSLQVQDTGVKGVSTAGHCDTNLEFTPLTDGINWYDLTFQQERFDATRDFQWHTITDGQVPLPGFYASTQNDIRTVSDSVAREDLSVGDRICHRGMITGYSCAKISSASFAPPEGCGPNHSIVCSPEWVKMVLDDQNGAAPLVCDEGDSGGPWFFGTLAHGLTSQALKTANGVTCIWVAYMPIRKIRSIGLELLLG